MSKTLNKGRDHYRQLQEKCRAKANNPRYPKPDGKLFRLSDRRYRAINHRRKLYKYVDHTGKERALNYETVTFVREALQ